MTDDFSCGMRYMLRISTPYDMDSLCYFAKLSQLLESAFQFYSICPDFIMSAFRYDPDTDSYRPFNYSVVQYCRFRAKLQNIKFSSCSGSKNP